MNNPKPRKLTTNKDNRFLVSNDSPYQDLYEKPLTQEQLKEIKFNLVNFVELLIKLDRQQTEWLTNNKSKEN